MVDVAAAPSSAAVEIVIVSAVVSTLTSVPQGEVAGLGSLLVPPDESPEEVVPIEVPVEPVVVELPVLAKWRRCWLRQTCRRSRACCF